MVEASFVMVHTEDQWRRAAHDNTSLAVDRGIVQLAWELEDRQDQPVAPAPPAALAFDPWCRLYRSLPEKGQVRVSLWSDKGPAAESTAAFQPRPLPAAGDFKPVAAEQPPLASPCGLAVDARGHLFATGFGHKQTAPLTRKRTRRGPKPVAIGCWSMT